MQPARMRYAAWIFAGYRCTGRWDNGILEEEQQGKDRADYGSYLIKNLAKQLQPEYGAAFLYASSNVADNLQTYPIASALRSQLNWTQYKMLITISDPNKREYYELETVNNCWTAREMERQINSQLYERLLLSNDKEAVLAVARKERIPQSPLEIIKDPMYLEFLGWSANRLIMKKIWNQPSLPICNTSCSKCYANLYITFLMPTNLLCKVT